ncbi:winged helix-turn-helix transcriptional regulator [Maricaulis sp.]|uniref:winged helix-turn-helix transcriptional regulator n=1 Tax=Maricaulis sp. TaxID=1486257 RepID=UPI001B0CCBC6|nr:winged helix-turn-helix transcriptional regulator [Maricaulis sp.]MBO6765252.1 winged helix-turn-helix transcriptional regulator [Maricaulis sp.]
MDINLLVNLTSKAWSLKILSLLDGGVPGRQAPLIAASGASRSAFAASLEHLIRIGLLERNPGHGHPLRPEFRLTQKGIAAAAIARRIVEIVPDDNAFAVIRRSWAVPILAVTERPARFSAIKTGLGSITDRALSQSLGALEQQAWVRRDIDVSQRTPFPIYHAINEGRQISRAISLAV